jgi:hypothetical protein
MRLVLLGLLSFLGACAPGDEADETSSAETSVTPLFADGSKLDVSDLTRVTVGFASQRLDDALSKGPTGISFDPPEVFSATGQSIPLLPSSLEVKPLDKIVSGLAATFGEKELATEVNAIRLRHLEAGRDKFYVESGFSVRAGIDHDWSFGAEGFEGPSVRIGIDAGVELASRIIFASPDDKVVTLLKAPLEGARALRGFVFPRSLDEIKALKPGEVYGLRGAGHLGANFGIGVPLLIGEPTGGLFYRVVASAGVAGVIAGEVDVELARLEGDEVVVDVGVTKGRAQSFHVQVKDAWGVKGICDDGQRCLRTMKLGDHSTDLSILVERAIANRLNKHLALSLQATVSKASSRVSLSRFRFHLDRGEEVEKALQQALKFDVRLAQALANRDLAQTSPAVVVDFDAMRAATTSTRSFGLDLFGMNVFHSAVVKKQGSFVLQTPEGLKTILFDTVHKDGGWFSGDHSFTRTGIAAQTLDRANPNAFRSEANLFLQTAVGDKHMTDDFIVDNIDATLLGLGATKLVAALDDTCNQMQKLIWTKCATFGEACNVELLATDEMIDIRQKGFDIVDRMVLELPEGQQGMARSLARSRIAMQSVGVHDANNAKGPNVSFTMNVRFDDKALAALTATSKAEYEEALRGYLTSVRGNRAKPNTPYDRAAAAAEVARVWGAEIERMGTTFDAQAKAYRAVLAAENAVGPALAGKRYVATPLGIRFTVAADEAKTLATAALESTSHERGRIAARLFDELKKSGSKIDGVLYDEHTAAYPLLSLVPPPNLDLAIALRVDTESDFWWRHERFERADLKSLELHVLGKDVSHISGGMFDLDMLLEKP